MTDITLLIVSNTKDIRIMDSLGGIRDFFKEIIIVFNHIPKINYQDKKVITYETDISNDFSALRNFALTKVRTEWIFFLDADELISDDLVSSLPKLTEKLNIDGFWIPRRNYISKNRYLKYGLFYPDYQLRLFRNRGFKFYGLVHEEINILGNKTVKINYPLYHFPYKSKYTLYSDYRNIYPYVRLQAKELLKGNKNRIEYLIRGIIVFFTMFFGGFIRGKGFLDGWAGFRSHFLFSFSQFHAYWLAALFYDEKSIF